MGSMLGKRAKHSVVACTVFVSSATLEGGLSRRCGFVGDLMKYGDQVSPFYGAAFITV